ncbi:uncharacterized protein LOC142587636 isoform X3 [Dermacentor variabilis]|uniref:uncharacterized protein LOC142587636 isoform X3 n=1 Tax=Dermacentor variabilis TaxID=34621 RepID=UPI003F5AE92B
MATFIQAGILFLLMCWEWCIVQACKHNEHKVQCYHHQGVPGNLCPGVERWPCSGTRKRCACVPETYQRWDAYCVPYRDCVFRTHKPEELLRIDEDLVMVGTTTTIFDQKILRCFVSSLVEPVYYNYHRYVKYQRLVNDVRSKVLHRIPWRKTPCRRRTRRTAVWNWRFPSSTCRQRLHDSVEAATKWTKNAMHVLGSQKCGRKSQLEM